MIFKGYNFRKTSKVIMNGTDAEHNVKFFRVVHYNKPIPKTAEIIEGRYWELDEKTQVYGVPITGEYSRTNMIYGDDGYTYVALNGKVYLRKR